MGLTSALTKSHRSGVNVKTEIGNELIEMLDQMFLLYFNEYQEDFTKHNLMDRYIDLHDLLGLTLIEIDDRQNE